MRLTEYADALTKMHEESSRLTLREMVKELDQSALRILLGEWEDAGVGLSTAQSAAESVFGELSDAATLEEAMMGYEHESACHEATTEDAVDDLELLREKSGKELEITLENVYKYYPDAWVIALALLGDYSTGVSSTTVAKAYFPERDHNRVKALNPELASVTAGGDDPVTEVTPGQFFEPMLASPKDLPQSTTSWVAEPKLDGYRLIIHWDGDEATAQTRRLNDVTHSLPELDEIDWPDQPLVLDCEVIAADGSYKSTSERIG